MYMYTNVVLNVCYIVFTKYTSDNGNYPYNKSNHRLLL